MMGIGTARNM